MKDMADHPITKSQFKLGLDCIQKLRHERVKLARKSQDDELLRLLAEGGAAVEALVRATEPGILIGGFREEALERSRAEVIRALVNARAGGHASLYEVTIQDGVFLARLDLLRIGPGGIELVEIKSKSVEATDGQVRPEVFLKQSGNVRAEWVSYVQDLAFQRELLRRWLRATAVAFVGDEVPVVTPKLLLVNKSGAASRGTTLDRRNFRSTYERTKKGVRAEVAYVGSAADRGLLVEIEMAPFVESMEADAQASSEVFRGMDLASCMAHMEQIVVSDRWPDALGSLGPGCKRCDFRVTDRMDSGFRRCWGLEQGDVPHHLTSLYYLSPSQCQRALEKRGRRAVVQDVEEDLIKPNQVLQYEALRRRSPVVTERFAENVKFEMRVAGWDRDVYFVDFETFSYPIPCRIGGRPFERIPFQFEGHQLTHPDAMLSERVRLEGFLELANPDPRRGFVDSLMQQLGSDGPVFHWHHFERDVLRDIRRTLQQESLADDGERLQFLERMVGSEAGNDGRLVDLMKVAQEAFYHPDMQGSYSIKRVLPVAWGLPEIRGNFIKGHGAVGDPEFYEGEFDPYANLPAPPKSLLDALGGAEAVRSIVVDGEEEDPSAAIRNGGMAMLAYHFARMFDRAEDPVVWTQLRQ